MAKFFGKVGYSTEMQEVRPGVYEDVAVEYPYYGDILSNFRALDSGDKVNPDVTVGNSISIVADAYAREHFFAMRYVWWQGARWEIKKVDVDYPRLILRLGGVYNGEKPIDDPSGGTE